MKWVRKRICVFVHYSQDGAVLPQQNIMISRAGNKIAAIVHCSSRKIDLMCSVLNYTKTFELEYGVPFIQACVSDSGRDMSASEFLCDTNDSTFLRYAPVAKMFIKNPKIYELV